MWYDDIHSGWYEHRYKYSDTDIKWSDGVFVAICAVSGDSGYRSDDKWYSTICERWHSYSVSDIRRWFKFYLCYHFHVFVCIESTCLNLKHIPYLLR